MKLVSMFKADKRMVNDVPYFEKFAKAEIYRLIKQQRKMGYVAYAPLEIMMYDQHADDFVNNLIPVVVSKDIAFINKFSVVENNNDALSIAEKIKNTLNFKKLLSFFNKVKLIDNSKLSEKQWLLFFKNKN